MYGRKFAFQNRLGQLIVGGKFAVFASFYFVFEGNFEVQAPMGLKFRGRFHGRSFVSRVWGAYIWRALFSEFYGMSLLNAKKKLLQLLIRCCCGDCTEVLLFTFAPFPEPAFALFVENKLLMISRYVYRFFRSILFGASLFDPRQLRFRLQNLEHQSS